ncbi:MAG: alpha/beta fold hydrolase [Candidatus Binataceae bacterium]
MRIIRRRDFIAASLLAPVAGFAAGLVDAAALLAAAIPPGKRKRGGPLVVTAPMTPPEEPCRIGPLLDPASPKGLLTRDYYLAPAALLDNPAASVDDNFGRVNRLLRENARLRDPKKILSNAVKLRVGSLKHLAIPVAQLAVTGADSFEKFAQWNPSNADLIRCVTQNDPALAANSGALKDAVRTVLDAAYAALWAIRSNDPGWRAHRPRLGWIGASGEDDLPRRPVNIPSAPFPQFNITLEINGQPVVGRYMIASAGTEFSPDAQPANPAPGTLRSIPGGHSAIPAKDRIIIYLHGGGSRLEEAVPLARQLIAAGAKRGQPYTVISFDMLNSGYTAPFTDPNLNSHPEASYRPTGDPGIPIVGNRTRGYPVIDTMERFIIGFIEALDREIGNVKNRIAAVIGGSLGGNMALMLARKKDEYPWLGTIVAWSATCMMPYRTGAEYLVGHQIAGIGGGLIEKWEAPEVVSSRREFFEELYYKPLAPGFLGHPLLPPQPDMWYRDGWEPCKKAFVEQTRFDRYEYYTPQYRQWINRLNFELAIYTFQEGDVYAPNNALGKPRYLSMTSRLLLAAGDRDEDWPLYTVFSSTREVAAKMANTPGATLLIKDTGHSIHDERPIFFADRIVSFLNDRNR